MVSGALGVSPYGIFFVGLLFLYDYGTHHGRGVADRLLQHLNVWKRASLFPSCNCSDGYGGDTTAFTGRERILISGPFKASRVFLHHMNFGRANNPSLLHGTSNLWTVQSFARFRRV